MSETSRGGGGAFAKVVQKKIARTRTKVLQRVGKAEKTTDEVFKDNIAAFQKQQATALRLQKEMKHYLNCVKAMSTAAKSLYAVLKDTYEEDWYDPHSFHSSLNSLELMHTSYDAELAERVYMDLHDYVEQFPVYKEKMNKRNRKRLDYDNAKHAYETLYTAKKPDHSKISKAHEALVDTKNLYEEINNELHKELPKFHDYRVEFAANNLLKLFNAEATFHTNTGKENDKLIELLQTLATSHAEEIERINNSPQSKDADMSHNASGAGEGLDLSSLSPDPRSPTKYNGHNGDGPSPRPHTQQRVSVEDTEARRAPPPARPVTAPQTPSASTPASADGNPFITSDDDESNPDPSDNVQTETLDKSQPATDDVPGNPFEDEDDEVAEAENEVAAEEKTSETVEEVAKPVTEEQTVVIIPPAQHTDTSDSKPSSSSTMSSSTVLYQVMATHPYVAEDDDELSFEAGEIINVIQFEGDEDELDDGWLMGINPNTQTKGVFPANFTQRIDRKT